MKIGIGDKIGTEMGEGIVVAITKEWVIYEMPDGKEYCLYKNDNGVLYIPAEIEWRGLEK